MIRRLAKYHRWVLWPPRLWILLRALGLAARAAIMVRRMPFPDFMERWSPPVAERERDTAPLVEGTDLVLVGTHQRRCFMRSLVLYRILRQAGHGVRFAMGVRPDPQGGILAHAWLEQDGEWVFPYGDRPELYTETFGYPPRQGSA
ncbi:MAG: lasso peptide biosynthesis B2 protein [Armatimonadia bacterium]|nr:lasso peptide biosynthesis B2 protein [Armatimonadia bacterium]